jgi:hypothetical protein
VPIRPSRTFALAAGRASFRLEQGFLQQFERRVCKRDHVGGPVARPRFQCPACDLLARNGEAGVARSVPISVAGRTGRAGLREPSVGSQSAPNGFREQTGNLLGGGTYSVQFVGRQVEQSAHRLAGINHPAAEKIG